MSFLLDRFREVWVVDFEFITQPNGSVWPVCLVAQEQRTNRKLRLWHNEFGSLPPYSIGPDSLFVAYQATAEASCHLALRWPRPEFILDFYNEHRWLINGETTKPTVTSLLRALSSEEIATITAEEKTTKRKLVMRGGPWSWDEYLEILDYCEGDVTQTARLLPRWLDKIDLPRATLRGRYSYALAFIERVGVPFDVEMRDRMKVSLPAIKGDLIRGVDKDFGVYPGGSWSDAKFVDYLNSKGMEWPVLPRGHLQLDDDVWEERTEVYPELRPLRYLRGILKRQRILDFPVGSDGRNRAFMNPFWTNTGRNLPSPAESILGAPSWLRPLVKPEKGKAFAVLDWSAQEFGIAAYLSGDVNMVRAYNSADIYLWFAIEIGDAPSDATPETHPELRDRYKPCILGTQYEVGTRTLASQLKRPARDATRLLRLHREIFPRYWQWLDEVKNHAFIHTWQFATFGWRKRITENSCNDRAAGNFHSQANGAEMLRWFAILATEAGLPVCGLMHDAVAIVSPEECIDNDVAAAIEFMGQASAKVLDGHRLRVGKPTIVRYPDRYLPKKGRALWEEITKRL